MSQEAPGSGFLMQGTSSKLQVHEKGTGWDSIPPLTNLGADVGEKSSRAVCTVGHTPE
jgi:hypothetical protein